jgi:hypothetical protein
MVAPSSDGAEVCSEEGYTFQEKIILNIFWRGGVMQMVTREILEER